MPIFGANKDFSLISLMSSILLFDAASISIRSIILPEFIDKQLSQNFLSPTGCKQQFGTFTQFTALANTLAIVVFPTPLGPVNKYAWLV